MEWQVRGENNDRKQHVEETTLSGEEEWKGEKRGDNNDGEPEVEETTLSGRMSGKRSRGERIIIANNKGGGTGLLHFWG